MTYCLYSVDKLHLTLHLLTSLYIPVRIPHSQADSACAHERQHVSTVGAPQTRIECLVPGHERRHETSTSTKLSLDSHQDEDRCSLS